MEATTEAFIEVPLDDAEFRTQLGLPGKLVFSKFTSDLTAADLRREVPAFIRPHIPRFQVELRAIAEFSPSHPQQGADKHLDLFHPTYVLSASNTPGYQQGIANFDSKYQGEFYPGYYVRPSVQLSYPLLSSQVTLFGHVVKFFVRLNEAKEYRFQRTIGSVPRQSAILRFHNAPVEFAIPFNITQNASYVLLEQLNGPGDNAKWTFVKAVVYRKEFVILA